MSGIALSILAGLAALTATAYSGTPKPERTEPMVEVMRHELNRAQASLGKLDPAPYYTSYTVHDDDELNIFASEGAITSSFGRRTRTADVSMRVGSAVLDNSHGRSRPSAMDVGLFPIENDPDALNRFLWHLTYEEYRRASRAYLAVKSEKQVHAQEEDTSADFSQETPHTRSDASETFGPIDRAVLEEKVRRSSTLFVKYSHIYRSSLSLTVHRGKRYFVSSEGSSIVTPTAVIRLILTASTRSDDGMDLQRVETFQGESVDVLPGDVEIQTRIEKMAADLKALRAAPPAEPFDGPALLSGRAAAVFFHEVLGHRLEGPRQRGEVEGQTFTKKIDQMVLPDFMSVTDDPTKRTLNGQMLSGWYEFDDEGVPAAPAELIRNGVLKSFLMSRMPVKNFDRSNGHGRGQAGFMPVARQGNLIVSSTKTVTEADLRKRLIDEIKRQGKPYGLYFEDIQGGFTITQRTAPQVFQVLPVSVWRVYPDGRPDELVRGVDIVGTPLAAMSHILMTGDKTDVFNGVCGAESGFIPVSTAAPAMLFSEIEVQKKPASVNRPPILPPPGFERLEKSEKPAASSNAGGGQ